MKNTIITSVSALVFLVIGLFIGKSNKQIEIQTVVKTNIVEKPVEKVVMQIVQKPVVEYVDKYITNFVEKVIQTEIPSGFKIAAHFMNQCYNGASLRSDNGRKLPFVESVDVKVIVSKDIKDLISDLQLKEKIQLEIRKAGIKIDADSRYLVLANIDSFQTNDKLQYIYKITLEMDTDIYIYDETSQSGYRSYDEIWTIDTYGLAGKNVFNQTYIYDIISKFSDSMVNKLLEAKERHSNPK